VASGVMWRWDAVLARKAHANGLRRHIISKKSLLEFTHSVGFRLTGAVLLVSPIEESAPLRPVERKEVDTHRD
jgi:hypothetical protein